MNYIENFTNEEVKQRFTKFPSEIKDGLDLCVLFSYHNLFGNKDVKVYQNYLEVFGIPEFYDDEFDTSETYDYFKNNFIRIYLPIEINGQVLVVVDMVDKNTQEDIKNRIPVIIFLNEMLPEMIILT